MDKWKGKVIVITGASKGIGKCLAKTFAGCGMQVVACARSVDKLKELEKEVCTCPRTKESGGKIDIRECDVGKIDDVVKLFAYVGSKYGALHACISNAGVALSDYFVPPPDKNGRYDKAKETADRDIIYKRWWTTLQTNLLGSAATCKEAINLMAATGSKNGVIVVVSSIAGQNVMVIDFAKTGYYLHMYGASKFGITAMTECLRQEVRRNPLVCDTRIVTLFPGFVRTSINDKTREEQGIKVKPSEEDFYAHISHLEPEDVCQALLSAFTCKPKVQIDDITINSVQEPGSNQIF